MGETDCGCWDYQQLRANYGAKCAEAEGERQIARWLSAEVEDLKLALHREAELADVRAGEVERLREVNRQLLEDATVVPASEYDALCDLIREAIPPGPKRLAALDQVQGSLGEWERRWLHRIFDGEASAELLHEDTALPLQQVHSQQEGES